MTRQHVTTMTMLAALLVVGSVAMAQTWGWTGHGYGMPPPGGTASWTSLTPGAQERIAELNQKIDRAQMELWQLQERGADWRDVSAKRNEVLQYRYDLARYLTDIPAWSGLSTAGPGGVQPEYPPPSGPTLGCQRPSTPPCAYRPSCPWSRGGSGGQSQQQSQSGGGQQQQQQQ